MGLWQDSHAVKIDLHRFRSDWQYIEQGAAYHVEEIAEYLHGVGLWPWVERLGEDDAYGCEVHEHRGCSVSRDLVDSIMELDFLGRGIATHPSRVLDIGAGYGRLAHRMVQAWPETTVCCTDAIPVSREVCAMYLAHREVTRARVVPPSKLDEIGPIDLAINIHSWSECTLPEIVWWLDWLASHNVPRLFVLPHDGIAMRSWGGDWHAPAPSFQPEIEAHGYRLTHEWAGPPCQLKYYYLFERAA